MSTPVGDKRRAAELTNSARKQYFEEVEELHALAEDLTRRSDAACAPPAKAARASASVAPRKGASLPEIAGAIAIETTPFAEWTSYAAPEGPAWLRFSELRQGVLDREGSWFISPVPQLQGPVAMLFGTWEKWFFSVWKDTCDRARQPFPEEVYNLGGGEPLPRVSVEEPLREAVEGAYKAIGAKGVAWKVEPSMGKTKARR